MYVCTVQFKYIQFEDDVTRLYRSQATLRLYYLAAVEKNLGVALEQG